MKGSWRYVIALFSLFILALVVSGCSVGNLPTKSEPAATAAVTPTPLAANVSPKATPLARRPARPGNVRPRPGTPPARPGQNRRPPAGKAATAKPLPVGTPAHASGSSASQVFTDSPLGVAFGPYQERGTRSSLDGLMTYIHDLGVPRTKVSFYWSKLEPQPGKYDFRELDAYLDQLGPNDWALLNLFTDGWCTTGKEVHSIKGAPLRDCPEGETNCAKHCDEYYREFVTKVAEEVRDHARGGIRYMQRDTEPASGLHFPADQPEAFVELQHIYYRAVKAVLPDMLVIGVNSNGNFSARGIGEPESADFFEYVLKHGQNDFDLLDVRLYGDPYAIGHRVDWFRSHMKANGYQKPVVSTEYGGVDPRTLHNGGDYLFMAQVRVTSSHCDDQPTQNRLRCARQWAADHVDQIDLKLRPFFGVASDEEQAQYEQLHCHDIVQRSILALSEGVKALWWWNLQSPGTDLIFGQMRLRTPSMEELPGYSCFQRFAGVMGNASSVRRIDVGNPDVYFFEVKRSDGSSMFVAWHRKGRLDIYDSAAQAPVNVSLPVPFSKVRVMDALGEEKEATVDGGKLQIALSDTPIFVQERGLSLVRGPRTRPTIFPTQQSLPRLGTPKRIETVTIPTAIRTPLVVATPESTVSPENPQVGLSFIRFYFGDTEPFQPETIFGDFADSGVQMYRHLVKADLTWRNIEPSDDDWHFETADSVIFGSPTPLIATVFDYSYASGTPPWCTKPSEFQKTLGPEALDYLSHVVQRYGPYVKYWEIGNEMEHWRAADPGVGTGGHKTTPLPKCLPADGFSPEEQGRFLAQVAQYIRAHDPDAVIVMPGMMGLSDYSLNRWFAGVLNGGGDWFDVVNYHYYGPWYRYPMLRAHLTAFLKAHGLSGKPVWLTETGSTSSPTLTERTDYPNRPETQAADVFRRLLEAWGAGDQLVLWHTYIGSVDSPNNVWREYGLRESDGSAKPALYSYRLLTRELVPFSKVTPVSVNRSGANVYKVETESGAVKYVAWGKGRLNVPPGVSRMTSVVPDASGNFAWRMVRPGQSIKLSEIPVLLK